jgi:hypothetical protein
MRRPLSEIIKEMACVVLNDPGGVPSTEAAHAALLFAHQAWERARRWNARDADYRPVLRQLEASNPNLWDELKSTDSETVIATLAAYKQARYPDDDRHIVVCGMRGDNVRVEWIDPPARRARPASRRRATRLSSHK